MTAAADEAGRVFFVVVPADDDPAVVRPTSAEVRAGTGAGGVVTLVVSSAADASTCDVDGGDMPSPCLARCSPPTGCSLTDGADYDVFIVAEDVPDDDDVSGDFSSSASLTGGRPAGTVVYSHQNNIYAPSLFCFKPFNTLRLKKGRVCSRTLIRDCLTIEYPVHTSRVFRRASTHSFVTV